MRGRHVWPRIEHAICPSRTARKGTGSVVGRGDNERFPLYCRAASALLLRPPRGRPPPGSSLPRRPQAPRGAADAPLAPGLASNRSAHARTGPPHRARPHRWPATRAARCPEEERQHVRARRRRSPRAGPRHPPPGAPIGRVPARSPPAAASPPRLGVVPDAAFPAGGHVRFRLSLLKDDAFRFLESGSLIGEAKFTLM